MTTKLRDVHEVEIRKLTTRQTEDVDVIEVGTASVLPLLREILSGREQESFVVLVVDARGRVTASREVARGHASRVEVPVRETFRAALLCDARAIILSHNHPSGDPTPSPEDEILTAQLTYAGAAIGCPVLDHIIIGEGERYFSFLSRGEPAGVDPRARRRGPDLDD